MSRRARSAGRRRTDGSCGGAARGARGSRSAGRTAGSPSALAPARALAVLMRCRWGARLDLLEVGVEMSPPALGLADHRLEPVDLLAEAGDLAVDPGKRVADDRLALVGVARRAEPLAIAGAGGLVLEELADLGQAEPCVIAEALDEPQAIEIVLVVQPVR